MRISRAEGDVNVTINGTKIEQVKSFKYLDYTMTDDEKDETVIKCRMRRKKGP